MDTRRGAIGRMVASVAALFAARKLGAVTTPAPALPFTLHPDGTVTDGAPELLDPTLPERLAVDHHHPWYDRLWVPRVDQAVTVDGRALDGVDMFNAAEGWAREIFTSAEYPHLRHRIVWGTVGVHYKGHGWAYGPTYPTNTRRVSADSAAVFQADDIVHRFARG